ncbi:MAG: response regulator, partial [Myxococcota bacterium]
MNGRARTTEPTLPRILFIDDDARLLSGIRRNLRRHRRDWEFAFAQGGANGIFALDQAPVDVLVTDLKMPGVAGDAVLRYAAEHYPDTVRVVMSGYADRSVTLETVQLAHQFLAKPCEGQVLRDRLDRIVGLRRVIVDEALRSGLGGVTSLPATPSLFGKLIELMASEDASVKEMTQIVQRDPSLSAMVLKVVNSAFVGITPTVTRVP